MNSQMDVMKFYNKAILLRSIEIDSTENPNCRTNGIIVKMVSDFFDCLKIDVFPQEEYEKLFGVEIIKSSNDILDPEYVSIGNLTYQAWSALSKNDYIKKEDVIDAILNGILPQFFQQKVCSAYEECNSYTDNNVRKWLGELLRRGFSEIPWDSEIQERATISTTIENIPDSIVWGLRIEADRMEPEHIHIDSSFEKVPIALAAGIPLYVKKLAIPGRECDNYIICRMMSVPSMGLAKLRWGYGGAFEPAPPVLMARSDNIAFTSKDWDVLDDFEMKMLDDGPREVTRQHFIDFVKIREYGTANIELEVIFPKGKQFRIDGLHTKVTLNGKIGKAIGMYDNNRVAIKIGQNVFKIKPENLSRV